MEVDHDVSVIWGVPFLATGDALIDVATRNLILRLNDEYITFNIYKMMKYPNLLFLFLVFKLTYLMLSLRNFK